MITTKFERSNIMVQEGTELAMDFNMEYDVGADSVIELKVGQSMQLEFSTTDTLACYDNKASASVECTQSTDSLLFPTLCKTGCATGATFSLKVTKGLKNVDYVMSKEKLTSIKRYIVLQVNIADTTQVNGNLLIFAEPFMKMGVLTMNKFTRSNNNIFEMSTLILKVTSESVIFQNNILTLGLPNNFLQDDQIFPNQVSCWRLDYDTEALI